MKIKTAVKSYDEVLALPIKKRKKPLKPNFILATVIRVLSIFSLYQLGLNTKKSEWKN